MSKDQQVYTPAFTSGVNIPTHTATAYGVTIAFRREPELIYNDQRFASGSRTGLLALNWESFPLQHFVFPLAYVIDRDAAVSLASQICNQFNRVNCSAFNCREGNFRLGCLPEAAVLGVRFT